MATFWYATPLARLLSGGTLLRDTPPPAAAAAPRAPLRPPPPAPEEHETQPPLHLRYVLPSTAIDASFFDALVQLKLEALCLDERPLDITGWLSSAPPGGTGHAHPVLTLNKLSFEHLSASTLGPGGAGSGGSATAGIAALPVPGVLLVFNSVDEFRAADKASLLDAHGGSRLWADTAAAADDPGLSAAAAASTTADWARFVLLVHVDIKGRRCVYWAGFPAVVATPLVSADVSAPAAEPPPLEELYAPVATSCHVLGEDDAAAAATLATVAEAFTRQPDELLMVAVSSGPVASAGAAPPAPDAGSHQLLSLPQYTDALRRRAFPPAASVWYCVRDFLPPAPATDLAAATVPASATDVTLRLGWPVRNAITGLARRYGLEQAALLVVRPSTPAGFGGADAGAPSQALLLTVRLTQPAADQAPLLRSPHVPSPGGASRGGVRLRPAAVAPVTKTASQPLLPRSPAAALATTTTAAAAVPAVTTLPTLPPGVRTVGWEPNERGGAGPRLVARPPPPDDAALAESASTLNLKLMRWRLLPELDLARLTRLRVLLLGAGTLGCHIARDLLAWGVGHFVFVDCGRVSYSNPVRQPLYEFADAASASADGATGGGGGGGGKLKAQAAADALRRIRPGVDARGVNLAIPMPDHPVAPGEESAVAAAVDALTALMRDADVTFLLTDTRESRWLPTLLAAAHGLTAFTVGLGFDSCLVMRHGVRAAPDAAALPATTGAAVSAPPRLGCYFCGDVTGPSNSTSNRSLDQQCTVSRPGLAPLASALAVELLVALLHHPAGVHAPSVACATAGGGGGGGGDAAAAAGCEPSPLGLVPHQIRFFLSSFAPLLAATPAQATCTACGDGVVGAYREAGE
jgi:ubiquitin-like modifier-activating enzyme ATG7